MKIIFLCGSLDPGKDGVGDYTRRLAGELIRQGHNAAIIALNDKIINAVTQTEQESDGTNIPVLRLPSNISNKGRYGYAENYIKDFNPEWLSLQFVPYSFHKKGLPFGLGKRLKRIGTGRKWHIMFHELWVGKNKQLSKDLIIQKVQIFIICNLLKKLKPQCIHSSLPCFKRDLENFNVRVFPLPIFSNIPVFPITKKIEDERIFRVAFFSQMEIHPCIIQYLTELYQQLTLLNTKMIITLIGGLSEKVTAFKRHLQILFPVQAVIQHTGFLQEKELSERLTQQDAGITSIPKHALGKSGSVAAFILHGVPVVAPCTHNQYTSSEWGYFDMDIVQYFKNALEINNLFYHNIEMNKKNQLSVQSISLQFINDLMLSI
jgi:hypothetical protein